MLCYMYKIHIDMVPDLGFLSDNGRQGVKYFAKQNNHASTAVQSLRTSCFFTQGPLLFNLLPEKLRAPARPATPEEAKKLKDRFKKWLDKWLELIPDQPTTPGISCDSRGADSNKLVDQVRAHSADIKIKWKDVERKLEDEERKAEEGRNNNSSRNNNRGSNNNNNNNNNTHKGRRKRKKNNYGQLTEETLRTIRNRAPTWDD